MIRYPIQGFYCKHCVVVLTVTLVAWTDIFESKSSLDHWVCFELVDMLRKWLFVSLMALATWGQSLPQSDQYLAGIQQLFPSFNEMNQYDGPLDVSGAPIITPINVKKPTREEMMYYNYYTASVNCPMSVKTMECSYCPKIKGDIKDYVGNMRALLQDRHKSRGKFLGLGRCNQAVGETHSIRIRRLSCLL